MISRTIIICIVFILFTSSSYSYDEQVSVRFKELTGDYVDEIILESKGSGGTGMYYESTRIYQDKHPELKLIFQIRTRSEAYGQEGQGVKEISTIEFVPSKENERVQNIIVNTKVIEYKTPKDDANNETKTKKIYR